MDRTLLEEHLVEAERQVALGLMHIARQRQLIDKLGHTGHDTTSAEKLLAEFEVIGETQMVARDRVARRLAEASR
jgi:hypothetical protein